MKFLALFLKRRFCFTHCRTITQKLCQKVQRHKCKFLTILFLFILLSVHFFLIPSFTKSYNDDCYIATKSMQTLKYILSNITDVFEAHSVEYWLDYGTLLGAMLDGDVIPWDSDGDVSFLRDDPNVDRAILKLKERGIDANTMVADMAGVNVDFMRWVKETGYYNGVRQEMLFKYYPPWVEDNIVVKINHRFDAFPLKWIGKRKKVPFLNRHAYVPIGDLALIKFRYKWTHWFRMSYKWKCYVPCFLMKQMHCSM